MNEKFDPFGNTGTTWIQHARDIASGYGLALQNSTLDHALWEFTAFPYSTVDEVTHQLHTCFRLMARGWWKRNISPPSPSVAETPASAAGVASGAPALTVEPRTPKNCEEGL